MHNNHEHKNHDCEHDHSSSTDNHIHPVVKNLKVAFILNLSFTVIEIIGGFFTNSVAILSDAIHDLGDSIAIGSSLWMERYSTKGRSVSFSYGYKRFSPLAAFINSLILLLGSTFILYQAVPRLINPEEVHAQGMLWMAVLGVLFNGVAALRLKTSGSSINQRAVMLHLLEDVMGWIAVLIGSVVIAYTNWYWIDPFLSLLIAAFILFNACRNLISVIKLFMQSVPTNVDQPKIIKELLSLPDVKEIHDFHSWSLDGSLNIATMHVVVDESTSVEAQKTLRQLIYKLLEKNNIHHPTIHIEYQNENCPLLLC